MNKTDAIQQFKIFNTELLADAPTTDIQCAWHNYTEALHRSGEITDKQINTWVQPPFCRNRTGVRIINSIELPVHNFSKIYWLPAFKASQRNTGFKVARGNLKTIELKQSTDYMVCAIVNNDYEMVVSCKETYMATHYQPGDIVG